MIKRIEKRKWGVPVKIWTDDVEPEAVEQLHKTAALPFVFKHVAVMPDVHAGCGSTIGSVIATKGAIVPACVGVDIGCGMMAVKTPFTSNKVMDKLGAIRRSIERSIPVGFEGNRHRSFEVSEWIAGWIQRTGIHKGKSASAINLRRVEEQLGSLGGGNHFIEICLDTEDNVWVMLHSGSRNLGKTVADYHIDKAKGLMKRFFIDTPDPDLAYLPEHTQEFTDYILDLHAAQEYAMENRAEMMRRVLKDLAYAVNGGEPFPRLVEVNCHHNYVARENHFGENVLVTRKGAVRARTGDLGIIPGSMGARSYIVQGLGNEDSFHSCSHGAGRKMSRTKARAHFTADDLVEQTRGVECRKDSGILDEIPGAYKPIEEVIANQADLVQVVAELKQVICVKG